MTSFCDLSKPCPTCGAKPGFKCVTGNGKSMGYSVHLDRFEGRATGSNRRKLKPHA